MRTKLLASALAMVMTFQATAYGDSSKGSHIYVSKKSAREIVIRDAYFRNYTRVTKSEDGQFLKISTCDSVTNECRPLGSSTGIYDVRDLEDLSRHFLASATVRGAVTGAGVIAVMIMGLSIAAYVEMAAPFVMIGVGGVIGIGAELILAAAETPFEKHRVVLQVLSETDLKARIDLATFNQQLLMLVKNCELGVVPVANF